MISPILVVLSLAVSVLLYLHLRRKDSKVAVVTYALKLGAVIGLVRSGLVCAGWWCVERTSGFLQKPGLFLTMLALPEGVFLPRSTKVLTFGGYVALGALVFLGAVAWVLVLALVVVARRRA
jgi:hypothetical protein